MRLQPIVVLHLCLCALTLPSRAHAADLTPAPASLTFTQQLGIPSPPQTVTWSNASGTAQTVLSLRVVGADAGDFQLSDPGNVYPAGLPDGVALDDMTVDFTPQGGAAGVSTANLEATLSGGRTVDCPLRGVVIAATVKVDPAIVDLRQVLVGTSKTLTVSLRNLGTGALEIDSLLLRNQNDPNLRLTLPNDLLSLPFSLPPALDEKFTVSCTPQMPIPITGEIDIDLHGDPNVSHVHILVACQGMAERPVLQVDSLHKIIQFPDSDSALLDVKDSHPQTVALHVPLSSTVPVTITDISSTNPEFIIDDSSTSTMLTPGDTTTFSVWFQPGMKGVRNGTVEISVQGVNDGPLVSIPATGIAVGAICQGYCGRDTGCSEVGRAGGSTTTLLLLALPGVLRWRRRGRRATRPAL